MASSRQQYNSSECPADESDDGESGDDTVDHDEPVIAGEGIGENAKVAPPQDMGSVPGYPNVKFDASLLPPPPSNVPKASDYKQPEFTKVPVITEETARTALLDYVEDQFCWGKGTAKKLQFTNLQSSTSYHYILETYTETRSTKYENVAFKGQPIDGPQNGIPPGPWDIITNPCDIFSDEIRKMEVPHTASVKPCHRCKATGYLICSSCSGRGRKRCGGCNGRGRKRRRVKRKNGWRTVTRTCGGCHGTGKRRCNRCSGTGRVVCGTCEGTTQLKWFIELTITWKNNLGHHIVEKTDLPDELIKDVAGTLGFQDTQPRVLPIAMFPEPEINQASHRLVNEHSKFPNCRILMQRHVIRMVPVTQCDYQHKETTLNYFVYGLDCKVHAPTYPDQCCWGCTIL
ncbi:protein SSUH2 homolog isoform X1 [Mytilus trossulus]|uniref:protein SSUH2 homolog isoform X1 n=1 Tax=Mytilus trossulus TaxID=6551 RepID=UPI0030060A1F